MREKKSIIAIVGPTASGKSELAVQLAKKFNGEIISADSRQVYRGLNIGSGKVKGRWQKKLNKSYEVQPHKTLIYKTIPHHCIDYVSPKKRYTVVDFQQCAQKAIEDIRARGKIPFLVGGTGFYIDAVLGDTL
ncbi:MAG: isopentenyl transferase family protein, partial [Patescibacteria group bacterium]